MPNVNSSFQSVRRRRTSPFLVSSVLSLLLLAAIVLTAGCSRKRFHKNAWFVTQHDVARYLKKALDHESPDVRRDAIERLSKTRFADHDTVVDACDIIARTDGSQSVRCAAIRLIAESGRQNAAKTLLALLDPEATGGTGGLPAGVQVSASGTRSELPVAHRRTRAGERVHVDALHGLYFLVRNGVVPAEQLQAVAAGAARHLREGESRDVRIAAARLLGEIPHMDVLSALITGLNHSDFGVVYTCERSLMRLTGVSHQHDPYAWRQWRTSTDEPFAMRGRLDHQLQPEATKHWWERMALSVKHAFLGFMPKRSE